jgi:four helix bundle protein
MKLIAQEVILQAVVAIGPVLAKVAKRDRELFEQMRDALNSAGLNLQEGAAFSNGNRQRHYGIAAGSASEVRMALQLAVAHGYVTRDEIAAADALLDRFGALTWRLRHPKR